MKVNNPVPISLLSAHYGKSEGVFVSSGTAALECALELSGVKPGDEVIVPSDCCFLVPASIVKCGAIPVFVGCRDQMLPTPKNFAQGMTPQVKAVIAVHHLGLPCDIKGIRDLDLHIPIIEDASLAFGMKQRLESIGKFSQYVVSSFGKGKPLSFSEGGGVFSNSEEIYNYFDRYSKRMALRPPPSCKILTKNKEAILLALAKANNALTKRRACVDIMKKTFSNTSIQFYEEPKNSEATWHRLPMWCSQKLSQLIVQDKNHIDFVQSSHATDLVDLPMFKKNRRVKGGRPYQPKPWLMKTFLPAQDMINWLAPLVQRAE